MVTGASRGIGRAIGLAFGQAGAHVVVNYRGNQAAARRIVGRDRGRGRATASFASSTSPRKTKSRRRRKKSLTRHKKIDILVNNAGVTADNLLMRMKPADWDQVIGTNLKGTVLCTKIVSRYMIRQRYGRIVNLSSVVGQMGNVGQSLYAASKAGIIGFTKSWPGKWRREA